jgi:hypothetical protein
MDCSHAQRCFSTYFEGDLQEEKRKIFSQHLHSCSQCRREYELFCASLEAVDELEEIHAPLFFEKRIRSVAEEYVKAKEEFHPNFRTRLSLMATALLRPRTIPLFLFLFLAIISLTFVSQIGEENLRKDTRVAEQSIPPIEAYRLTSEENLDKLNRDINRLILEREKRADRNGVTMGESEYKNNRPYYVTESTKSSDDIFSDIEAMPVTEEVLQRGGQRRIFFHDFVIDSARIRPVPTIISF